MRDDAAKGHLDLLILSVLADGELHGYAVIDSLRTNSGGAFDLPEGTVYPALHRLEKSGLLQSTWSEHAGRKRKNYRLTATGLEALATGRSRWDSFAAAVSRTVSGGGATWPKTV